MTGTEFDNILRQNVINALGVNCFGYGIGKKNFPNYYCTSEFANFLNQMMTDYSNHYNKYDAGKGGELKQKGNTPPKMASVGSSSRFCYLALRNGTEVLDAQKEDVEFEYSCERQEGIKGGSPPQMDAYVAKKNTFVEVKCHEIFAKHKVILSKQYESLIFGDKSDFGFSAPGENLENSFLLSLKEFGMDNEDGTQFDIKQLLCHLLGVKYRKNKEPATLVYLFFKPKVPNALLQREIDEIFEKLKTEIKSVFNSNPIRRFIDKNNITLKAVAEYSEVMSPLTNENIIHLYSVYPKI